MIWITLLCLALVACSTQTPRKQIEQRGFKTSVVEGSGFLHLLVSKPGPADRLNIYLEGDGRPWLQRNRISLDPTPLNPLMLDLFALDEGPAIYLGRPCYWQLDDPLCSPELWTSGRYSLQVVDSLNAVIDQFSNSFKSIALIGHSGGGTLAMLLAARRNDVELVATLAGNLDIEAWASDHKYTPLAGSLNPANDPPLPAHIRQYHFIGTEDEIVTAQMIGTTVNRQADANLVILDGFDHSCCWQEIWPGFLAGPH